MDYSNRRYAIIDASHKGSIDFTQTLEKSADKIRESVDESKFLLRWYTTNEPTFITNGSVPVLWSGTQKECFVKMSTSEWNNND